jgi:hypothetical protein
VGLQAREQLACVVDVGHHGALGDLQHELGGRQPTGVQGGQYRLLQVGVVEMGDGDIHRDVQPRQPRAQYGGIAADPVERPPAAGLGVVHGRLGEPDKVGRRMRRADRDADGRADMQPLTVQVERLGQRRHEVLGDLAGVVFVGVLADHDESVAAEPGDGVLGPCGRCQPLPDAYEQLVAGVVAPGVVDELELVEVDHHDGDR